MPKKVLVINGHGSKLAKKIHINAQHGIITPGNAGSSYVVSFDDKERHLEEMTSQGQIWPIVNGKGKPIQWHRYQDTDIHDITISPLQSGFKFKFFADSVLKKKTKWENLSNPAHDVLACGALAVRRSNGQIDILENEALSAYLTQGAQGTNQGVPIFFCDKNIGKVKPLGDTSLSEIYAGIALIKEFQTSGTEVIVATCSPSTEKQENIIVQTYQSPTNLTDTAFVNISSSTKESTKDSEEEGMETSKESKGLTAYVLVDPQGDNYVDSVEEKNGTYIIKGRNASGAPRSITIDKNGNATGFNGSQELGVVGRQMYTQREAIFQHFNIKVAKRMTLNDTLQSIESAVGKFSDYQTTTGHGQDIPFPQKPAQQFLHGLGVPNVSVPLSKKPHGQTLPQTGNGDVTISSFDPKSSDKLVITGARIDRLVKSAKTYVNTDIFPKGHFQEILSPETLTAQTQEKSSKTGVHLQNMAVGLCHVQEIDLLATPIIVYDGKAVLGPRKGTIDVDAPAMLLLSTPALNVAYGTGKNLTKEQQVEYIESMYRLLFHAASNEGREYIAMPAAGLGVFGGDPEMYFNALMNVAKDFPKLNIIYHSGKPGNAPIFDKLLKQHGLENLVRTDRDVLLVAHELTQQGKPCAFHNPSDADVVLGINDVGEYWKNGKGSGYVGEEHIGAMSTAPLNSRLLNPNAYQNVVEHSFLKNPLYTLVEHSDKQEEAPKEHIEAPPKSKVQEETPKEHTEHIHPKIHNTKAKNPNAFFKAPPPKTSTQEKTDNLTQQQFQDIRKQIDILKGEINSWIPYPNKDRKQHKVDALEELITLTKTRSIEEAVEEIKEKYPDVTAGKYSTRTADLLVSLVTESNNLKANK
ncbi:hypothetical protein [Legionella brunensis]|uniref:Uncharacterized protein n=1 Tax=Legionella brunensis TaxID=29422 RepID=A0A0W0S4H2_9GAMM|nr:hypothetical protein [Legionella brunensis]KTC78242.1 hypothetical protein Lbru_2534 [Legionella brunensis]